MPAGAAAGFHREPAVGGLLHEEPVPAGRVVLGHFIFIYIQSYTTYSTEV